MIENTTYIKTIVNYIAILALTFMVQSVFAQNLTLKTIAEASNKSCPQEVMGGMIRMLSYKYENNIFELSMEINMGDMFDMTKVSSKPTEAKELIGVMLTNMYKSSAGVIFDEIIKSNARYRTKLSSMFVPNRLIITYTIPELKKLFAKYGKMTHSERVLTMQVMLINLQAPVVEDEYITMDRLELSETSLIYYETIDDNLLGTPTLKKEDIDELKQALIFSLSLSPAKDNVINACLNSFRTITYNFTMKYSKNKYVIELKSNDLREILK